MEGLVAVSSFSALYFIMYAYKRLRFSLSRSVVIKFFKRPKLCDFCVVIDLHFCFCAAVDSIFRVFKLCFLLS